MARLCQCQHQSLQLCDCKELCEIFNILLFQCDMALQNNCYLKVLIRNVIFKKMQQQKQDYISQNTLNFYYAGRGIIAQSKIQLLAVKFYPWYDAKLKQRYLDRTFLQKNERLYELFINQQFVNENPFLVVVFGSTKSLFADMLVNMKRIGANDEGTITYTMLVNSKPMSISFNSKQKKLTKEQKILRLVSQLTKNHEQNIYCLKKDQEILKQENDQLKQKINGMVQLNKFHESNLKILSQLKKLRIDHEELKNELEKQKNNTIEHRKQIKTLKVQLQDTKLKIDHLTIEKPAEAINIKMKDKEIPLIAGKKIDEQNNQTVQTLNQKEKRQIMNIKPQQQANEKMIALINTQNIKRFEMIKNLKNLKLKYIGLNQNWYSFHQPFALETNKITRMHVLQSKTAYKSILYGISTDKTIGMKDPDKHIECKSYYAGNGRVFQNGNWRTGGAAINDGTVITIIADLINWKIIWEANGNKLEEAAISSVMRPNKLYFIITMGNQNDEVEILDY